MGYWEDWKTRTFLYNPQRFLVPSGILTILTGEIDLRYFGKRSVWIPANQMTPRTTAGAAATTREINGITIPVLAFDQTSDEGANFTYAFPKRWNAGTITYQPFWTATGGAGVETVQFELRGGCFANSAAINTTGFGTAIAVDDTWLADDDIHIASESAVVTLANAADGTQAIFEILRDVSDDDLTADAELIGIMLNYTESAGHDE
jgi:hypothetical protein